MYKKFFKPILDFIFAFILLALLLPILIPIIILLLLTGEHEVFYLQKRVGYKNEDFKIWKFATMLKNSANMGTGSLTIRNDPRVTRVGRFLRKSKLNELPQLINVLIGNMSLVGPRPQMSVDFYKFSKAIQETIYNSKPGITGIGSIIFRDEEKLISNATGDKHEFYKFHIAPYKGELEIWYQKNVNLLTDIKLLFCTAWVVIFSNSKIPYILFKDLPKKPESETKL